MCRAWLRGFALCSALFAASTGADASRAADDLAAWLERVGASVERYFARAQSLICLETVTVQQLQHDLSPMQTPARRLQYELRLTWEPSSTGEREVTAQRQLLKVGGRAARPKDKPGCTDPKEVSPEPLALLLPDNQKELSFSLAGRARLNGRDAVMLDYRSLEVGPVTSKALDADCVRIELPGRERGRFWIDTETNDILRHDTWLRGVFDVEPPKTRDWRNALMMTIERLDSSTVYRPVAFSDPDETIMLPRSTDRLQVIRNSSNMRMHHNFSDYRRFMTSGRVVQE